MYVILCLLCTCCSLRGDLVWESKDYGYQQQLSYQAFKYGFRLMEKSQGDEKHALARELSIMSFYYWLDTQRTGELHNRGVEIMIKSKLYPFISKYEKETNRLFYRDPLAWLNHDNPVINPLPLYKLTKNKYTKYIIDFERFLNSPISKPKTRVKFKNE